MGLLVFYLCLALFVSFLCSLMEATLLSITPSFIEAEEQKGSSLGKKLKKLKSNIDRPLAAILSLNTAAHTIGAAGVGVQGAIVFGEAYVGVISAVLTLLILVFTEIIPKTLGVSFWRSLTGFTVNTLQVMIIIMYPLVLMSQGITKLLSKDKKQQSVSRAEIYAMADMGHKEGIFEESESRILKNLIRLRSIRVEDIMTPRTVVVASPEERTLNDLFVNHKDFLRFSRIPVYHEQIDNITGFILKHDLLDKLANDHHDLKLSNIKREIMMVNEEMRLPELFDKFIAQKEQIALALDEYGGMAGIVTMEDLLETILGLEIVDESDSTRDMQEYARQRWKQRAKKLGIVPEEAIHPDKSQREEEDEDIMKYGITGASETGNTESENSEEDRPEDSEDIRNPDKSGGHKNS